MLFNGIRSARLPVGPKKAFGCFGAPCPLGAGARRHASTATKKGDPRVARLSDGHLLHGGAAHPSGSLIVDVAGAAAVAALGLTGAHAGVFHFKVDHLIPPYVRDVVFFSGTGENPVIPLPSKRMRPGEYPFMPGMYLFSLWHFPMVSSTDYANGRRMPTRRCRFF